MAAESGGGSLMKVLGEYGVFLVEMESLKDIYGSLNAMSRIKHTCMSIGRKYIAVGSTSGSIYIYNRKTLEYIRLISTKEGGIIRLCFGHEKSYLGVATSNGIVLVIAIGSRTRDKPKCLRRSEEHKNATVTCMCWDDKESRLFSGDDRGFVSATYLPTKFGSSVNHPKKSLIGHKSAIIGKSETAINQLDYAAEKLLISTMTKTAVLDLATSQCWLVGSKPREGAFGACFLKQFNQDSATIYTARPGSRLWEASMDGQVISTQHYKQLLAVPPSPVLGYGHEADTAHSKDKQKPRSFNFAKLLLIRERFLLTWQDCTIFLLDPVLGQLAGWYQLNQEISDVCCHGNQFYIYHSDSHMTWYGLLTVKETVARLFEIRDFKQCTTVALECKSYLIPSNARDWVPVSMVTSLIRKIQEQPDSQKLVESLQEIEQLLQENTNVSDKPPGFHADWNMIDSPETMSINSDICSHHMDSGLEDDDNLSANGEQATGFQKDKKEFSFENALFTVAAKAKKFAEDRQKSNILRIPSFRRVSSDSATRETKQNEDLIEERKDNESMETETNEGPSTEELSGKADSSTSEMSPGVPRKTPSFDVPGSDGVVDLSDDNESKCDPDTLDITSRKSKDKARDKKKKKRRIVTVIDINTPSNKTPEKKSSKQQERKMRSESYSSYEDSKLKIQKSQSDRSSPIPYVLAPSLKDVPTELPPAIPAMISKAKVLIKKKLTPGETGVENPFDVQLPQAIPDQNEGEATEEEDEKEEPRPVEVDKLENVTAKVREEVRAPKVLYNRKALRHVLQEWLPVLHSALNSCNESSSSSQSPGLCLKNWLNETSYGDVCMVTQMCLDTGVYGETEDQSRDQKECSHDSCALVEKEAIERFHSEKEYSLAEHECKKETESSSCHGDSTSDVMTRDQEICSRVLKTHESDVRDTSETPTRHQDHESSRDCFDVIRSDKEQSYDGHPVDTEGSRKVSQEQNNEQGKSKTASLSANYDCHMEEKSEWTCETCSRYHDMTVGHVTTEAEVEKKRDWDRACFIRRYFELLRVKDIRRALSVTAGYKHASWSMLLQCIRESFREDDVTNHTKDGHVTRALHVLHDGILEYQDSLLLHLVNLYELSGRETLMTCVRMYPDVLPWEVMEICRQGMSRDPQTSTEYFVYYIDQLLRWGVDVRERRTQKIKTFCRDQEFTRNWFHSSLIASNPDSQRHCQCGLPRSGSHKLPWKHEEHLKQLLDVVCQRRVVSEMAVFLDMCWRHGYWAGVLRLCAAMNHRKPIIEVIVSLGDMANLDPDQPWGPTPQSLNEWKALLELVATKTSESPQHACADKKDSDWSPDINWENVVHLALKRLGASRLVPLLQDAPYQDMSLPINFYHKCIMGIVIEKEQSNLIRQMLTKLDTYFWSKRAGVLTPEMNFERIQEQESKPSKDDSVATATSLSRVKTIEDAATNWGVNIHLADAVCPVCTLLLGDQVSSSNQGLLVFECGHVFHRFCVPERACVVCFHQGLKTLGKTRMSNEGNTAGLI